MIVKEKGRDISVEVYMLYWKDNKRYHMVIPYDGYEGLIVLDENQVDVLDPSIDNFIMRKDDYDGEILIHKATVENNLIYELIDHDAEAMKEFKRRLAEYE